MTDAKALRDLIAAVEAGAISTDLIGEAFGHGWDDIRALAAFDGSLDAARALHDALLPGCSATIDIMGKVDLYAPYDNDDWEWIGDAEIAAQPARAWLLAILRARLAEMESTNG